MQLGPKYIAFLECSTEHPLNTQCVSSNLSSCHQQLFLFQTTLTNDIIYSIIQAMGDQKVNLNVSSYLTLIFNWSLRLAILPCEYYFNLSLLPPNSSPCLHNWFLCLHASSLLTHCYQSYIYKMQYDHIARMVKTLQWLLGV